MNSFPSTNIDIMGGIKKFSFAPMDDIESISGLSVTFKTSKAWLDGISNALNAKLSIKPKSSANGIMHESAFEGVYPGNSVEISELMNEMLNYRFALLIVDSDNMVYLIQNMEFKSSFNTDGPIGKKQWDFSFYTQSLTPPTSF